MCFSAVASFTSGALLLGIWGAAMHKNRSRSSIPFALIPVFFGIQQIVEGIVWSSFGVTTGIHEVAMYTFLMFSHVFWPIYVPVSILLIEKDPIRKKILIGIVITGVSIGAYLFSGILIGPVTCGILQNSISYTTPVAVPLVSFACYLIATCAASMVSSSKKIQIFWTTMLVSFFVAHAWYPETFFSVWCFFAAALSVIIYIHMRDLHRLFEGGFLENWHMK